MNLMIVTNSAYLHTAYVMLYSLFANHGNDTIDIYLPYEDLNAKELLSLERFVSSFPNKTLTPLYVGTEFKHKVCSYSNIQIDTYYRILGTALLPDQLERILYLDVDMVVKQPLHGLYHTELSDHPFVVCEDIYGILNGFHETNKSRLHIPAQFTYFNAGVMLYNLEYLRAHDSVEHMLRRIYQNYERYVYNDQDVMNELFYETVLWSGWDAYNCPPAWYYLDLEQAGQNIVAFADYDKLKELSKDASLAQTYRNITAQIYGDAKIIHYLGDTKPWSKTRKPARVYDLFDQAYLDYAAALAQFQSEQA